MATKIKIDKKKLNALVFGMDERTANEQTPTQALWSLHNKIVAYSRWNPNHCENNLIKEWKEQVHEQ